jgi:hypothetical protein
MTHETISLWASILSPIASVGVALTVLWVGPRLTFMVWKKQKLREQQLEVAKKFAEVSTNFFVFFNIKPIRDEDASDTAKIVEAFAPVFEQQLTMTLIAVLFKHEPTLDNLDKLKEGFGEEGGSHEKLSEMSRVRNEISALLYAEALEVPMRSFKGDPPLTTPKR